MNFATAAYLKVISLFWRGFLYHVSSLITPNLYSTVENGFARKGHSLEIGNLRLEVHRPCFVIKLRAFWKVTQRLKINSIRCCHRQYLHKEARSISTQQISFKMYVIPLCWIYNATAQQTPCHQHSHGQNKKVSTNRGAKF